MKKSQKSKAIEQCEALYRKILFSLNGEQCQFCGRKVNLGLFHILPKGLYPRIRLNQENLLIACWFPCHFNWHHNYYKAHEIEKKIIQIKGSDYKDRLKMLDKISPKLNMNRINLIHESLKQTVEDMGI